MATEENKDPLAFDENVDPYYKKGFEHGYWLKKWKSPELNGIMKRNKHAQYGAGLRDGSKEAAREYVRERINRIDKQNEKNRDRGFEIE